MLNRQFLNQRNYLTEEEIEFLWSEEGYNLSREIEEALNFDEEEEEPGTGGGVDELQT